MSESLLLQAYIVCEFVISTITEYVVDVAVVTAVSRQTNEEHY